MFQTKDLDKVYQIFLRVALMLFMLVRVIALFLPIVLVSSQTQTAFGLFEGLFGPRQPCLSKRDIVSKGGFLVYDNKDHKVQNQYPSDWTKENNNGKYTSGDSTLYTLVTFQTNTEDGFKSTLELEINDLSSYSEDLKSLSDLADFEKVSILLLPESSIISSQETQINTCPAHQIVYLEPIPGKQDQWKSILTVLIDCNKEYVMHYTATDSNLYDRYLETIGDMIQTYHVSKC
jgi:hypothetical protein